MSFKPSKSRNVQPALPQLPQVSGLVSESLHGMLFELLNLRARTTPNRGPHVARSHRSMLAALAALCSPTSSGSRAAVVACCRQDERGKKRERERRILFWPCIDWQVVYGFCDSPYSSEFTWEDRRKKTYGGGPFFCVARCFYVLTSSWEPHQT